MANLVTVSITCPTCGKVVYGVGQDEESARIVAEENLEWHKIHDLSHIWEHRK